MFLITYFYRLIKFKQSLFSFSMRSRECSSSYLSRLGRVSDTGLIILIVLFKEIILYRAPLIPADASSGQAHRSLDYVAGHSKRVK